MLYIIWYLLISLLLFLWAGKFLLSTTFLPYHAQVIGRQWDQVDKKIQLLILALMRVVGVCLFALSTFVVAATYKIYSENDMYLNRLLPVILILVTSGLFAVTFTVYRKTGANTPWPVTLSTLIANCIVSICTFLF